MLIYLYFDELNQLEDEELEAFTAAVPAKLATWRAEQEGISLLVDSSDSNVVLPFKRNDWDLGFSVETRKARPLKNLLNFLNPLCQEHKVVMAVGFWDEDSQSCEDVCFFGYEEAEGDFFEIANYLDLKL